ncbi:MAD2L1-binding protein [Pristis pectinata]|uniref:MAD2L1-binding protein n=1 Tax=Pristis pectinata TaxID=685728 RepID=UPI00223D6CB7|nr:MAD2L1-binding protein [Pristis pectinata]
MTDRQGQRFPKKTEIQIGRPEFYAGIAHARKLRRRWAGSAHAPWERFGQGAGAGLRMRKHRRGKFEMANGSEPGVREAAGPEPGVDRPGEGAGPEPGVDRPGEGAGPEPGVDRPGEGAGPEPGVDRPGEGAGPEPGVDRPGEGAGPEPGVDRPGEGAGPEPGVDRPGEGAGPEPGVDRPGEGAGPEPGVDRPGEGAGPEPGVDRPGEGAGPEPGVDRPGEGAGPEPGVSELKGEEGPEPWGGQEARAVSVSEAKPECRSVMGPGRRSSGGARVEAELPVLFPGQVTRKSCCRLVCELLKHVLYQRQQLPLPYDQLAFFTKRECRPDDCSVLSRSIRNEQNNCKKSQRMLLELDEVFQNLEAMFMLTLVPCVHILMGGSVVNPKEMYEINMEQVAFGSTEESLKTISCIRQLFHALFIKDLFNELKSVPLMNTVLLVRGHRNCGTQWFRPKLNYRVPNRTRKLIISLACDTMSLTSAEEQRPSYNSDDYIWFQAPITIKGFQYQ